MTKWGVVLFVVLAVLVVCALVFPLEQFLLRIQQWAVAFPALAAWIVGTAFVLGAILLLPLSPVVMLAGFLFGMVKGFALIWVTGLFASSLTFWIGRSSARPWVERKLKNRTIFIAVDRAIARKGLWVVILTRLAMVFPYGPLNYSLGLSSVRLRDYLLGTNIGMIPPFLLVVYLGTTASSIAAMVSEGIWPEGQSLLLGLLSVAIVALAATVIARSAVKVLREELAAATTEGDRSAGS